MTKRTYVVSVLDVPLSANGELQRAMAVDVGAGRMDWLAAVVEARWRASTAEQLRQRMKVAASVEVCQTDWLVVDLEMRQPESIEEQARRQRAMPASVEERQMDLLVVDAEEQSAMNEGPMGRPAVDGEGQRAMQPVQTADWMVSE